MAEITITDIECVVTKLRLDPGDALVVRCTEAHSQRQYEQIRDAFTEAFGLPAIVLPTGITLEAVLNIPPELAERAREYGRKRREEQIEKFRKAVKP